VDPVVAVLVKNQATVNKLVELVCLLTSQVLLYSVVEAVVLTLELVVMVAAVTEALTLVVKLVLPILAVAAVDPVTLMLLVAVNVAVVQVVLASLFFVFLTPLLLRSLV
jgi:hypothetical protein